MYLLHVGFFSALIPALKCMISSCKHSWMFDPEYWEEGTDVFKLCPQNLMRYFHDNKFEASQKLKRLGMWNKSHDLKNLSCLTSDLGGFFIAFFLELNCLEEINGDRESIRTDPGT